MHQYTGETKSYKVETIEPFPGYFAIEAEQPNVLDSNEIHETAEPEKPFDGYDTILAGQPLEAHEAPGEPGDEKFD